MRWAYLKAGWGTEKYTILFTLVLLAVGTWFGISSTDSIAYIVYNMIGLVLTAGLLGFQINMAGYKNLVLAELESRGWSKTKRRSGQYIFPDTIEGITLHAEVINAEEKIDRITSRSKENTT